MKTTASLFFITMIFLLTNDPVFTREPFWKEANDRMLALRDQGKFLAAEKFGEEILKSAKQTFGENDSNYIATMRNLGLIYRDHGQLEQAEIRFKRALDLEEMRLKADPRIDKRNLIPYLSALADLYYSQRKNDKAKPLYTRILNIHRECSTNGIPTYWLKKVAKFYKSIGELEESKKLEAQVNTDRYSN